MYYDMTPEKRINDWIRNVKENIRAKLIARMDSVAPNETFTKAEIIQYLDEIIGERKGEK